MPRMRFHGVANPPARNPVDVLPDGPAWSRMTQTYRANAKLIDELRRARDGNCGTTSLAIETC